MLFLQKINTQNTNCDYELKAGQDLSLLGCYDPEDETTTNLKNDSNYLPFNTV
jgi:hypothetical protein